MTSLWTDGPLPVKYTILTDHQQDQDTDIQSNELSKSGPFKVTPNGLVVVNGNLDHERQRTHQITVMNQTLSTPPAMDYMTISVVVSYRL